MILPQYIGFVIPNFLPSFFESFSTYLGFSIPYGILTIIVFGCFISWYLIIFCERKKEYRKFKNYYIVNVTSEIILANIFFNQILFTEPESFFYWLFICILNVLTVIMGLIYFLLKRKVYLKSKVSAKKMDTLKVKTQKEVKPRKILCPYCFTKIPINTEYCPNCRTNLKEKEEKFEELREENKEIKEEGELFNEEVVDMGDIANKNVIVNILKSKGGNPQDFEALLKKMLQKNDEREIITSEIARVPEGTVEDFLKSYELIIKELESKKPEYDFNNEHYFNEGRGE